MTFLEPDWRQERPDTRDVHGALASLRFEPFPLESPPFQELLAALQTTHVNGGALFARFHLLADPVLHWFGSRNRLDEILFFERFLTSSALRAALPELQPGEVLTTDPAFEWGSAFTLDGELARRLSGGGAYERFRGTAREAKAAAWRGCRDLLDERYDEVLVYRSLKPWSPWFQDVAWDATWLGIDKRDLTVWLLCVTDTD